MGLTLESDSLCRKIGPVFAHYRRSCLYWELYSLAYRALFVLGVVVVRDAAVGAQQALVLALLVLSKVVAVGAYRPYRKGSSAFALDATCAALLFIGLVSGVLATTLEIAELGLDVDHAEFGVPPHAPRALSELESWGSAQVMNFVGVGALCVGMVAIPTAVIYDVMGVVGRRQRRHKIGRHAHAGIMMQLFPRSHRALDAQLAQFGPNLAEEFQRDLVQLKHVADAFSNYTQGEPSSRQSKAPPKTGGGVLRGRPIKMSEIGEIASQGADIVGCTCELFRWVQNGSRKEAQWCPATILDYDPGNLQHKLKWGSADGRAQVREEWLNLASETLKMPTVDALSFLNQLEEHAADAAFEAYKKSDDGRMGRASTKARVVLQREKDFQLLERIKHGVVVNAASPRRGTGGPQTHREVARSRAHIKNESLVEDRIVSKLKTRASGTATRRDPDVVGEHLILDVGPPRGTRNLVEPIGQEDIIFNNIRSKLAPIQHGSVASATGRRGSSAQMQNASSNADLHGRRRFPLIRNSDDGVDMRYHRESAMGPEVGTSSDESGADSPSLEVDL